MLLHLGFFLLCQVICVIKREQWSNTHTGWMTIIDSILGTQPYILFKWVELLQKCRGWNDTTYLELHSDQFVIKPFIFGSWLLLQRDICSTTWSIFDSQCRIKELKLSSQTLPPFTPFFWENWHRLLLSLQSSLSTNILGTKLPWHWVNPCSFKLCSQGKKTDLEFR